MSDPYVYTPRVNYRNSPYLAPYYTQANSPFIPSLSLSGSPFSPNVPLPEPPAAPSPFIPFPTSSELDDDEWDPYVRPRVTSWTTGTIPPTIPQNAPWFKPRRPQRQRSRSAGYFDQPQIVNINNGYWVSPGPGTPYGQYAQLPTVPQLALHPYLDGHKPGTDVVFDLMAPSFAPMRRVGNGHVLLSKEELFQVATHPPLYDIRMIHDLIPNWPVELVYNPLDRYSAVAPPLKLGDVLAAIYNALQMRISQNHWASLSPQAVHMVGRTYTERCRSMGPYELTVMNDGVKRIDFLQGKRWFRGLTKTSDPKVFTINVG